MSTVTTDTGISETERTVQASHWRVRGACRAGSSRATGQKNSQACSSIIKPLHWCWTYIWYNEQEVHCCHVGYRVIGSQYQKASIHDMHGSWSLSLDTKLNRPDRWVLPKVLEKSVLSTPSSPCWRNRTWVSRMKSTSTIEKLCQSTQMIGKQSAPGNCG